MDKQHKLIDTKTGRELQIGEIVTTFRGESRKLTDWEAPLHEGSTGRVYLRSLDEDDFFGDHGYFPSVVNAQIVEVKDARIRS